MSNEIIFSFQSGISLYAVIRNADPDSDDVGKVWNEIDDTWDDWVIGDVDKYKITVTENGTNGMCYVGSFPVSITAQGRYFIQILNDIDDEVEKDGWIDWSGIEQVFVALRHGIR